MSDTFCNISRSLSSHYFNIICHNFMKDNTIKIQQFHRISCSYIGNEYASLASGQFFMRSIYILYSYMFNFRSFFTIEEKYAAFIQIRYLYGSLVSISYMIKAVS